MASLRTALAGIGEPRTVPLHLRASFGGRTPRSLRSAVDGMTDPGVSRWAEAGIALQSENTQLSEEAQGLATDGASWYVCSNNTKQVVRFDDAARRTAVYVPTPLVWQSLSSDSHFGALGYFDGWLYVAVQDPRGVWRFTIDGGTHQWLAAVALPDDDLFPWCAVHPTTGMLYTCNYGRPRFLRAYDRGTLQYRPEHDVALGPAPLDLDHVQGGVFTTRGRLVLVRSDFNAIFCYSSLNGHCFGAKALGDFDSARSEVESVVVREWAFGGVRAPLHVQELDNDWSSKDDLYVHSYRVPDPDRL